MRAHEREQNCQINYCCNEPSNLIFHSALRIPLMTPSALETPPLETRLPRPGIIPFRVLIAACEITEPCFAGSFAIASNSPVKPDAIDFAAPEVPELVPASADEIAAVSVPVSPVGTQSFLMILSISGSNPVAAPPAVFG